MNWISLILQLFALRRSLHDSQSMVEAARQYAERGKRAVAATLVAGLAGLFLFSGILVAVIEAGLEIDRGGGIRYSGLMVSATILAGIGLVILLWAWQLGRSSPPPPPPPRAPESPRTERIKDLLEEFAVSFLQQLLKPSDRKPGSSEKQP